MIKKTSFYDKDKFFLCLVVEMHNQWSQFSRAVALSAYFNPKLSDGVRARLNGQSFSCMDDYRYYCASQFKHYLRKQNPKRITRRDEPDWADISKVYKILSGVGYSEIDRVNSAANLCGADISNFTSVRNFYAHKNDETLGKVVDICRRSYSMPLRGGEHLSEVLTMSAYSRPQPIIVDWLSKLRIAAEFIS